MNKESPSPWSISTLINFLCRARMRLACSNFTARPCGGVGGVVLAREKGGASFCRVDRIGVVSSLWVSSCVWLEAGSESFSLCSEPRNRSWELSSGAFTVSENPSWGWRSVPKSKSTGAPFCTWTIASTLHPLTVAIWSLTCATRFNLLPQ